MREQIIMSMHEENEPWETTDLVQRTAIRSRTHSDTNLRECTTLVILL